MSDHRTDRDLVTSLAGLRGPAPDFVRTGVLLGTGLADGVARFDSPLGPVAVVFSAAGVVRLDLDHAASEPTGPDGRPVVEARPPTAWKDAIPRAIEAGTPGTLPVDHRGRTPFQRAVLTVAAEIPRGEVRPYGWLARAVGREGAVRAVGSVMSGNRLPLIIPCHRVVRSDGTIGDYSLGGPDNKRRLLSVEGLDPRWLELLAARKARFVGSDTTRVFCVPTCRHATRISDRHRVEFPSTAAALEAGFRPCERCRP